MINRRTAAALLALSLTSSLLAGCAGNVTGYPSLNPRPVEREVLQAVPVPAAPQPDVAPVQLSADIAQIVATATAADAAFRNSVEKGRARIEAGRSAPEGSEAWVLAQQAYSDAESAAAPVGDALAECDRRRQAAIAAGNASEEAALAEATQTVQALQDAERAVLGQLMPA